MENVQQQFQGQGDYFCSRGRVKKERNPVDSQQTKKHMSVKQIIWTNGEIKRMEIREPVAERVGAACKQNTQKPDTANPKGNIQAECV